MKSMLPLLLTIKKSKSSSSLETTECCMDIKVAWSIYEFHDERQMQCRNINSFGESVLFMQLTTRETLIGGKFYRRPLFVQHSTVTYFSWQTRTRGSENKAVLVLCDSKQPGVLLQLTKEYSAHFKMQINVNYITDSIRTPQEKHSVGVINNPVYLCCMEECVHSDSYTNHRSTPC